jgi:hypothetical protein
MKRLKGECRKKGSRGRAKKKGSRGSAKKKAQGGVQKKKAQGGVQQKKKAPGGLQTNGECKRRGSRGNKHLAFCIFASKFDFWCLEKKSTLMGEFRNPRGNAFGLIARSCCGNEILDSPTRLDFFSRRQNANTLSGYLEHGPNRVH